MSYVERRMLRTCRARLPVLVCCFALIPACTAGPSQQAHSSPVNQTSSPPPAVSGIDDTISVRMSLADTFDVLPNGNCAGRLIYQGVRDGARVLLQGNSTTWGVETRAVVHLEHRKPIMSRGKPLLFDDYVYCVAEAVFTPPMPDPAGYSIKFAGTSSWDDLGQPTHAATDSAHGGEWSGWNYDFSTQMCPSLLDPPEKDCRLP